MLKGTTAKLAKMSQSGGSGAGDKLSGRLEVGDSDGQWKGLGGLAKGWFFSAWSRSCRGTFCRKDGGRGWGLPS